MAKKYLIKDDVQLHDLLSLFDENEPVRIMTKEDKTLFKLDEYLSDSTLAEDYGEKTIKFITHRKDEVKVYLWI